MKLLIVESPTKERTISKFLDDHYIVKSSYGHVRDLPKNELGIDLNHDFKPEYVTLPRIKKILPQLKQLSEKAETIYLATDYDREGEAIAWHISQLLPTGRDKIKRITFHEITRDAINAAITQPRQINLDLVNAQQTRRILDRLVGYKISPLLWRSIKKGLSAGRVQSVALRLIAQRESEITEFKPQEYWTVSAEFKNRTEILFPAQLIRYASKKIDKLDLKEQSQVEQIVRELQVLDYTVNKVEKKERKRHPFPPFVTSTMQQDSSRQLGFSASRTMSIAQQLYEGIDLGDQGAVGLITYHRTDSVNTATIAQKEAIKYISTVLGEKYIPPKPRIYITKTKGAQEAHEAIRPSSVNRSPETLKKYLTPDQYALYDLIWRRFVASQMSDAVYDTVSVDLVPKNNDINDHLFRATGQTLKFAGFLHIYGIVEEEGKSEKGKPGVKETEPEVSTNKMLPELNETEPVSLVKLLPEQHFTEPPPRYNEASLIKTLEKNGIGRPSTYAPIISTIIDRGYSKISERKFYLTELGKVVNSLMEKYFSTIVNIDFTANMEEKLDEIAQNKMDWVNVLRDFYTSFTQILTQAQKELLTGNGRLFISNQTGGASNILTQINSEPTDKLCPECNSPMVLKIGKYGKFYSCTKFPQCKKTISFNQSVVNSPVEVTDVKCDKCDKPMVIRQGKRGKFIACSGFPKCRNTRNLPPAEPTATNP